MDTMSTRYTVTLIGPGRRSVEEQVPFERKKDAVAYAKAGLQRFRVYEAWVAREQRVEYEVCLFPEDERIVWVDDGLVYRQRRLLTPAEVDANRQETVAAALERLRA